MSKAVYPEDVTAGKLVLAGIELFGEHGFKGTTTRMIAASAGSNIGSIAYYFGNKQGLYLACARHIAGRIREHFQLDDPAVVGDDSRPVDKADARRQLEQLVRRMVRLFVWEDEAVRWLMLVMREQTNPTEAFDILYRDAFEVTQRTIAGLIAILMERDPADKRVLLEAHTLVGEIVFFLVGRTPLLRRLGGGDTYPADIAQMAETVVVSHLALLERHPGASDLYEPGT